MTGYLPVPWNFGKRAIRCSYCGAEHTLTLQPMTARCKFCGSKTVAIQQITRVLEQPSALIPFHVDAVQAGVLLGKLLRGPSKQTGVLYPVSEQVEIGPVSGVYLPYWAFDFEVEVRRIRSSLEALTPSIPEAWSEQVKGVFVCAVEALQSEPINQLEAFDLTPLTPYLPRFLAQHPVHLYTVGKPLAFQKARERTEDRMRQKYRPLLSKAAPGKTGMLLSEMIHTATTIRPVTLRLILLPFWVAPLYDKGQGLRIGIVSGQTGQLVVGAFHRNSPGNM